MKKPLRVALTLTAAAALWAAHWAHRRYAVSQTMDIPVLEFTNFQYPEDPAYRGIHYGEYTGRKLELIKEANGLFDFVFVPFDSRTAKIVFKDVDARLMNPRPPVWVKGHPNLERIALTDREWNRQQVAFNPHGGHIEILGGDGWEQTHLTSAELAANCLNAGLWEVLLYTRENGRKAIYYHGWFTFPLGYIKGMIEKSTGASYWPRWRYLEHWANPQGLPVHLSVLRKVLSQARVQASYNPNEPIIAQGEQIDKRRIVDAVNLSTFGDILTDWKNIHFAAFVPPGRYSVGHPWENEYWRLARFQGAILRRIQSPASARPLDEIELDFQSRGGKPCRYIISGLRLDSLPELAPDDYPKGLYSPMGIGTPPFNQSYKDLTAQPPSRSPYFCVMLDDQGRWLNHHAIAIDGPVLLRDKAHPARLEVYLLSYERQMLIGHYVVDTHRPLE